MRRKAIGFRKVIALTLTLVLALSTMAFADTAAYVMKNGDAYTQFSIEELKASYEAWKYNDPESDEAAMYRAYLAAGEMVAFLDDKSGYVTYKQLTDKYEALKYGGDDLTPEQVLQLLLAYQEGSPQDAIFAEGDNIDVTLINPDGTPGDSLTVRDGQPVGPSDELAIINVKAASSNEDEGAQTADVTITATAQNYAGYTEASVELIPDATPEPMSLPVDDDEEAVDDDEAVIEEEAVDVDAVVEEEAGDDDEAVDEDATDESENAISVLSVLTQIVDDVLTFGEDDEVNGDTDGNALLVKVAIGAEGAIEYKFEGVAFGSYTAVVTVGDVSEEIQFDVPVEDPGTDPLEEAKQAVAVALAALGNIDGVENDNELASAKAAVTTAQNARANILALDPDYNVSALDAAIVVVQGYIDAYEASQPATITGVAVVNPTTIRITFEGELDAAYDNPANYTLSKGKVDSAHKTGDQQITLTVQGLTYGDNFTLTIGSPVYTASLSVPEISDLFTLYVTSDAEKNTIKSDGVAMSMLTAKIWDNTKEEYITADALIVFSTTYGALSQPKVAMQNGAASTQLTSQYSATSVSTVVTATVDQAPGFEAFVGLTGKLNMNFTPDGGPTGTITMVSAVSAGASQGDRFYVRFSDQISAASASAKTALKNAVKYFAGQTLVERSIVVKDVYNLTPDTLVFVLDTDTPGSVLANGNPTETEMIDEQYTTQSNPNYLRDNANHAVGFPNGVSGLVVAGSPLKFMMVDTTSPVAYGVTAIDNMNLEVRFNKSMAEDLVEGFKRVGPGNIYKVNEHFTIDGQALMLRVSATDDSGYSQIADQAAIDYAKANNYIIVDKLYVGKYTDELNDTRNKVYISIHKDFRLKTGNHGIQIANVGDWAGMVDVTQNRITTQTFTFYVEEDTVAPEATVTMQSPEQWLITFSRPVEPVTGKTIADTIKIYNKTEYEKAVAQRTAYTQSADLYHDNYILTAVDEDGMAIGGILNPAALSFGAPVERILVEFTRDWSVTLRNGSESMNNYWKSGINPFQVVIGNLESATGVKMVEKALPVATPYDGTSPTIAEAEDLNDKVGSAMFRGFSAPSTGEYVYVKMSEPVQLVEKDAMNNVVSVSKPITPSLQQFPGITTEYDDTTGIPVPVYRFIKGDKSVLGTLVGSTVAADDYSFLIKPATKLEPGTWTLYIESISDDHGNTTATIKKEVIVPTPTVIPVESVTQVLWAAFDAAAVSGTNDYLYVKFSQVMKAQGAANGVDSITNYKFMGQALPGSSQIIKGIKGVTDDWDGVTIILPKGTWTGSSSAATYTTNMSVASNFISAGGQSLTGAYQFELTHNAPALASNDMDGLTSAVNFEAYYSLYGQSGIALILAANLGLAEGSFSVSGTTLTITGNNTISENRIIDPGLTLIVPDGVNLTIEATLTVPKGATVNFSKDDITLASTGKVVISGTAVRDGLPLIGTTTGALINLGADASVIITEPSAGKINYALDGGICTLGTGAIALDNADESVTVNNGATLVVPSGSDVTIAGTLTVAKGGKVSVDGAGSLTIDDGGKFVFTETAFAVATGVAPAASTVASGTLTGDVTVTSAGIAADDVLETLTGLGTTITYLGDNNATQAWTDHTASSGEKVVTITAGASTATRAAQ